MANGSHILVAIDESLNWNGSLLNDYKINQHVDYFLFIYYLFIIKIVHNSTTYKINIGINVEDEYIIKTVNFY